MLTAIQRLKLALMTEGMSVTPAARDRVAGAGPSRRPLTLADYASTSGVSLRLENDVWVNAPIVDFNANFVTSPTAVLDAGNDGFILRHGHLEVVAIPVPVPDYHDKTNAQGERFTNYGITHTDRVRISPVWGCANTCQFCDIPYRLGYRRNEPDRLVESVVRAIADAALPARHVLISGGTPVAADYEYLQDVYRRVCCAVPTVAVDAMMAPMPGLLDAAHLRAIGLHGMSINLEIYDEQRARQIMPNKAKVGRQAYLAFIEHAAAVFGPGRVRSLLLLGLEPLDDTLRGVEALAERGCDPVLSPFRPDPATPLRNVPPPSAAVLGEVYERALEIVERHGVKLGPRCIPCQHNTLTFPDASGAYYYS
jgi:hypothetical protein